MLQQFFAFFAFLIILWIVLLVITIAIPMWRFMERADTVIKLYNFFKVLLKKDFSQEEKIHLTYGKYKMAFANTYEASIEFEKLIQEALEYYDKLGWIAVVCSDFQVQKDELVNICYEIRKLRWKNQ